MNNIKEMLNISFDEEKFDKFHEERAEMNVVYNC